MYCIYHSADLDGIFSGAIVKHFKNNVKLIPYNYGDKLPELEPNELVVICDVSLPIEELDFVCKNSYLQTMWIDHHKSAKDIFEAEQENYKYLKYVQTSLDLTKSGCEQTWEYFFPDVPVPFLVKCIADYDVWRNNDTAFWESIILPVQYGCRYFFKKPADVIYFYENYEQQEQANYVVQEFASVGNYIWDWTKDSYKSLAKHKMFSGSVLDTGEKCAFINTPSANSLIFDYIEDKSFDFCIVFSEDKKGYNFSVYSPFKGLDCSAFARKHGGGGHVGAAGFTSPHFNTIFKKDENIH